MSHLKKRGNTWFVRVAVPRPLRPIVGRDEYVRTTGTSDRRLADRRKHSIIADIQLEIDLAVESDKSSERWLERQALALRRSVERGELDAELAGELIGQLRDQHLQAAGIDDEKLPASSGKAERLSSLHRMATDPFYKPLSQLVDDYLDEREPDIRPSTLATIRKVLEAFSEWLPGDPPISEITRKQTGRYVSERVMKSGKAANTKKDTVSYLSGFFKWAIRRGMYEQENPWNGLRDDLGGSKRGSEQRSVRRPWKPAEIRKINLLDRDDPMHPMLVIALHTGMRREEIAGLKLEDVNLEERMFIVTEAKNQNSVRQVPIHPDIYELVSRWYERSTDGYLIAGLKAGGTDAKRAQTIGAIISKWIRRHVTDDPGVVFHSTRNTFTHRAERAGIPEHSTQLIVGHARQSLTYGLYSGNPGLELLDSAINQISYPELNLEE